MLPDWLQAWQGDLPTLAAFMCDFVETVLGRYKHDVRRWIVCAGFNQTDTLGLNQDERLRLVYRLFEAATQVDPELELVLSVAQPWGDYLIHDDQNLSPLTFPDDLIRAGMRLSAVELEVRLGLSERASYQRDTQELARVLNLYGLLGLPLELLLSCPAGVGDRADTPGEQTDDLRPAWRTAPSPDQQARWGEACAALGLCTPHVRAVTWDHWSDSQPHVTTAAGLIDSAGVARPLLEKLRSLRAAHLR